MLVAYEGNQPYIFISYSHRNSRYIHGVIEFLQNSGYRVWFDGGIEAGSEWPEYIASHLEGCSCVLTFMSNAFVASDNCKRELHFAQDLKKPLLNVYIEEVNLPAGLRMQLGLCQAMYRDNFRTEGEFLNSLARAKILADCREKQVEAVVMQPVSAKDSDSQEESVFNWKHDDIPHSEEETEAALQEYEKDLEDYDDELQELMGEDEEDDHQSEYRPTPKGMKVAGWIATILEMSYFLLWPKALELLTSGELGVWMLIFLSALPHVAIAVITKILLEAVSMKYPYKHYSDAGSRLFVVTPVVTVVSAFTGVSGVCYDLSGFVKFLISLGLNIIPAAIAVLIYLFIDENKGAGKA